MPSVLIVEDNKTNADVLSRRLQNRGWRIQIATNGRIGVEQALANRPDIILMDIGMPELDGIEAAKLLKAHDATKAIPIIAITASAFDSDRVAATEAGCDWFQTKPVDIEELVKHMRMLLGLPDPDTPQP
jgi:CheY-like chemotaxis protein